MRASAPAVLACITLIGVSGPLTLAQEFDPVEDGHSLVTMYCTDCHATEDVGESPHATAPRFRDLHLRYDVDALSEALVEGIVTAHPDMPQFEFDPDQAAAIVAYLKSLELTEPSDIPNNPVESKATHR